jgi:hypothetical protein
VSGNFAANIGGGVANVAGGNAPVVLNNVTIADNTSVQGGGIANFSGNAYRLRNTIVARNTGSGHEKDLGAGGTFVSNGNNLIGNTTSFPGVFLNGVNGDQSGTTAAPLDPKIGPLSLNGGNTLTHPLTLASSAINTGHNCVFSQTCAADGPSPAIRTDQRGAARSGTAGNPVDIGAFENLAGFIEELPPAEPEEPVNIVVAPNAGNFNFMIANGALPPGLMLGANRVMRTNSPAGVEVQIAITGTPAPGSAGTYNFTITASDGTNMFSTAYSMLVTDGAISGSVSYAIVTKPVPGVAFTALGALNPSATSGANGTYMLQNFGAGPYTVTPAKLPQQCGTSNGIQANDASLIAQYVVGLRTFSTAELAAARVAGIDPISSFDAGLVARRVVGLCTMPSSLAGEWRFTPANRSYTDVLTPVTGQNYTAVMIGDVSGDWDPSGVARPAVADRLNGPLAVIGSAAAAKGSIVEIPLTLERLGGAGITSFQFTVEYDPAVIEPARLAADLGGTLAEGLMTVFNVSSPGTLRVAVYGAFPATGDGLYARLRFAVIGSPGTASGIVVRDLGFNDSSIGVTMINGKVTITKAIPDARAAFY